MNQLWKSIIDHIVAGMKSYGHGTPEDLQKMEEAQSYEDIGKVFVQAKIPGGTSNGRNDLIMFCKDSYITFDHWLNQVTAEGADSADMMSRSPHEKFRLPPDKTIVCGQGLGTYISNVHDVAVHYQQQFDELNSKLGGSDLTDLIGL